MSDFLKIFVLLVIYACSDDSGGGSNNDSDNGNGNNPANTIPISSNYIEPSNNEVCTGAELSPTTIEVNFEWLPFQDVEDNSLDYTLRVIDQSTGALADIQNLSQTSTDALLHRGVTYTWNVTATDDQGASVIGASWQFQTPFEAASNYAPFPASMFVPNNGQTYSTPYVTFGWEGNDPDPGETNQLTYDLYVSEISPPEILVADITDEFYDTVLTPGIYFWKVVSKDPNGNISHSQIVQFEMQ
jgi:hypothetical protein